jgi:hypothetical protein
MQVLAVARHPHSTSATRLHLPYRHPPARSDNVVHGMPVARQRLVCLDLELTHRSLDLKLTYRSEV